MTRLVRKSREFVLYSLLTPTLPKQGSMDCSALTDFFWRALDIPTNTL